MTRPLSGAAIRLKNANRAFRVLDRAARAGTVDEFSRALDGMLANLPSKTCSLHNWEAQIGNALINFATATGLEGKMDLLLSRTCVIESWSRYGQGWPLIGCVEKERFGLIPLLCKAGLHMGPHDDVVSPVLFQVYRGRWPCLETLCPDFFETYPLRFLGDEPDRYPGWSRNQVMDALFDHGLYAKGEGFFSVDFMRRLLPMAAGSVWFEQEIKAHLETSREFNLQIQKQTGDPAPWLEGLALAVGGGLVGMDHLKALSMRKPHIQSVLPALQSCIQNQEMESRTAPATTPSRMARL